MLWSNNKVGNTIKYWERDRETERERERLHCTSWHKRAESLIETLCHYYPWLPTPALSVVIVLVYILFPSDMVDMIFRAQTYSWKINSVLGGEDSVPAVTLPASAMASSQTDRKINLERICHILVITRALAWAIAG